MITPIIPLPTVETTAPQPAKDAAAPVTKDATVPTTHDTSDWLVTEDWVLLQVAFFLNCTREEDGGRCTWPSLLKSRMLS